MRRKPAKSRRGKNGKPTALEPVALPQPADARQKSPVARESIARPIALDGPEELRDDLESADFRPARDTEPVEDTAAISTEATTDGIEESPERGAGSEGGSLVPFDPLSRYFAEIRRFPILSREEEQEIARRYQRDQDPQDAYKLVTSNLRLVVKIANEFARASRNLLDLIQEGNVGLMEAVTKFNPELGIRFPSYAVWWIRAYIYRYLINNWRLVKIGTTQAQRKLFFNLRKESERLEAEGFAPKPKLLAQRLGVKESEVREMQERMAQSEVSLDKPVGAEDDTRLIDVIPDTDWNPEERASNLEWRDFAHEKVEQFAATLKDKELDIFRSRLLSDNPPTLQAVGDRFGISRERVRQIETRLKQRLKEFLQKGAGAGDPAQT